MAEATNTEKENEEVAKVGQLEKKEGEKEESGIDYEKIQQMITQALSSKEEKSKEQQEPDAPGNASDLQTQMTQMQEVLQQTQIENAAILEAVGLGIDAKTIPYILKMADFSTVIDLKGNINKDTIKAIINKVMEDVPGLKTQIQQQSSGFKIGATNNNPQNLQEEQLASIFGNKK